MKTIKTLKMLLLTLVFAINSAVAEEITLLLATPPGGSTERTIDTIKEVLTSAGHTVTRKNFKSHVTALDTMINSPKNSFLITYNGEVFLGGKVGTAFSPPVNPDLNVAVYSGLTAAPLYLTTLPGKSVTSLEKLRELSKTRKVILGTQITPVTSKLLEAFAKKNLEKYAVLNYASSGEMRAAIAASEIDVVFSTFFAKDLVSKGGTNIAVSSKMYSTTEITYMGDPDFLPGNSFMHIKNSSTPAVDKAMLIAMGSPELIKLLAGLSGKIHGLASGISAKETSDQLLMLGKAYGQ
jgi:hypothetical protein